MRILMVDDRIEDWDRISCLLQNVWDDLDLTRVGDPVAYERALSAGPTDLVLTEGSLGWAGVLEVLRDVRERMPGVPVIMLTSSGCECLAIEGFRVGLSDYVSKEQAAEELLPAILRVTDRRPAAAKEAEIASQQAELACLREELHRERTLLQTIFDYAPVMFTIYDPRTERIYTGKHVERVTGWTEADTAETPIIELAYPDPEYRAAVIAYRDSLAPGYRDMEMRSKSGGVIQASWANIGLPDGRRMGIGLDITQRKEAERELQRAVAEFTALYNQMTEGLVLFDPQGNLLDMNPAALAIHGLDDVRNLRRHLHTLGDTFELFDLETGRLLTTDEWPIGRVLRGETFASFEVRVRRTTTERAWIGSYGGTPVYGPDGELLLAIVTVRDVTAQREAEQALSASEARTRRVLESMQEADEALRQRAAELEAANDANRLLLREVNHRVKNNLTAILGLIYAEQRRLAAEACPTAVHTRCLTALEVLSERVRSLAVAHSLLSANGWRPLRADELVEAVVRASVPAAADADALVLDVTSNPLCVSPEQAHCLALVIGELTTNTVKYGVGADRLHIFVEIGLENGEVSMRYRNSGPGYPETVLNGEGHSVGLGLVHTLVTHSLRGTWSIRNDTGPVTEIHFPLSCSDRATSTTPPPAIHAATNGR